jgi:hypothetical protein
VFLICCPLLEDATTPHLGLVLNVALKGSDPKAIWFHRIFYLLTFPHPLRSLFAPPFTCSHTPVPGTGLAGLHSGDAEDGTGRGDRPAEPAAAAPGGPGRGQLCGCVQVLSDDNWKHLHFIAKEGL